VAFYHRVLSASLHNRYSQNVISVTLIPTIEIYRTYKYYRYKECNFSAFSNQKK